MANFMEIGEPTAGRLATALSLILEGRCVGFGRYSLAAAEGALRVDVDYPATQQNDELAIQAIESASLEIDSLLATVDAYKQALERLPRKFFLVRLVGNNEQK